MVALMKRSTETYAALQAVLVRIRALHNEFEANAPITSISRLSTAQQAENERRALRGAAIAVELGQLNGEATSLRKQYSEAMSAEQHPPAAEPTVSIEMQALVDKRTDLMEELIECGAVSVRNALPAVSGGDKAAQTALDRATRDGDRAFAQIGHADIAIAALKNRETEERREFIEREADGKFAAGQRLAEEIVAYAHSICLAEKSLTAMYARYHEKLRALPKTGVEIDYPRYNTLSSIGIRHRSAKANGLASVYDISVRDAVPLEDASRQLLKLAIKRPTPKADAA
jgi:hypothetical protein